MLCLRWIKNKLRLTNPILLYVAMILAAVGLFLSLLVIIVYYKKMCMSYLNGYISHKREKANANDKVLDIEKEVVEMVPMKTTAQSQNKEDYKQDTKKKPLLFKFADNH